MEFSDVVNNNKITLISAAANCNFKNYRQLVILDETNWKKPLFDLLDAIASRYNLELRETRAYIYATSQNGGTINFLNKDMCEIYRLRGQKFNNIISLVPLTAEENDDLCCILRTL